MIDWGKPIRSSLDNPAHLALQEPVEVLRTDRQSSLGYCVQVCDAAGQSFLYTIDGYPDSGGPWIENVP